MTSVRVVIVTGASRGLGKAVAQRLAREGVHLVLSGRDAAALQEVADELHRLVPSPADCVAAVAGDVSNATDVERLTQRALEVNGRIDGLVCNAGIYGPMGRIEDVDWNEWVEAIRINLFGTVLCCRAVVPVMRNQHYGKIVLLSGGGATQPLPRLSGYAAAKAAVVRFAETLAEETREAGIDVNAVAPGALNTRLLDQVIEAGPDRVGESFYARALTQRENGGTPLETPADLISFLLSSASDGVSGRLISAVWDNWRELPAQREALVGSDVYTLRRIVPQDRGWASQ